MSTYDDFIAAIVDSPADSQRKQVFADFLEERDDPRAELVRLQFQLASSSPYDSERVKLLARERKLLKQHGTFGDAPAPATAVVVRGGFIEGVRANCQRFLEHGDRIARSIPLRELWLVGRRGRVADVCKWPGVRKLEAIRILMSQVNEADVIRFVTSPNLDGLKELWLHGPMISDLTINAIANHSHLRQLTKLVYIGPYCSSLVRALGQSSILPNLDTLAIYRDRLREDLDVEPFPRATPFAQLKTLLVPYLSNKGLHSLLDCCSPTMEELRIGAWGQHDTSCFGHFPNLKKLQFREHGTCASQRGQIAPEELRSILDSCGALRDLNLTNNTLENAGAEAIAEHPRLEQLSRLGLCQAMIGYEGADALGASAYRTRRAAIQLEGNSLTLLQQARLESKYGSKFGRFRQSDIPRSEFLPR